MNQVARFLLKIKIVRSVRLFFMTLNNNSYYPEKKEKHIIKDFLTTCYGV